jgi:hypothetical protein
LQEPIDTVDPTERLDINKEHKRHLIFGGTKILLQTPPKASVGDIRAPPDHGCPAYVLRTGFNTGQGKLIRTILFGTERVSINNRESLYFILFLLIFAGILLSFLFLLSRAVRSLLSFCVLCFSCGRRLCAAERVAGRDALALQTAAQLHYDYHLRCAARTADGAVARWYVLLHHMSFMHFVFEGRGNDIIPACQTPLEVRCIHATSTPFMTC